MTDTEPTEKSEYRRLKRRVIRRRGRVVLGGKIGGDENGGESTIRAQHTTSVRLIWINEQGAWVFTKTRHRAGESFALTLLFAEESPIAIVGEVVGMRKMEKHGGYLVKFNFLYPDPEQVETIDNLLFEIDSAVAQEMRMVL